MLVVQPLTDTNATSDAQVAAKVASVARHVFLVSVILGIVILMPAFTQHGFGNT